MMVVMAFGKKCAAAGNRPRAAVEGSSHIQRSRESLQHVDNRQLTDDLTVAGQLKLESIHDLLGHEVVPQIPSEPAV
jgi:hypothetical protein